jgi:large subunit ribosomal protein L22
MQVKATARYVRVAPNKARQVVAHIRGLGVDEARRLLQFSPKGVAEQILKTLDSAAANAEHNHDLDADDLYVAAAVVDEGPTLKRYQPRAMGRAYRIRKRTSHITVTLGVKELATAPAGRRGRGTTTSEAAPAAKRTKASKDDAAPAATSTKSEAAPAAEPEQGGAAADAGEKE